MCWYSNDQTTYTANKYGALYKWYAVSPSNNGYKNLCPTGWHVPSDAEWTTLTDYLGGLSLAGGKMKSIGTQFWTSPNTGATNESGFSGLPGGIRRDDNGGFVGVGGNGLWWSSTEYQTFYAWYRYLNNGSVELTRIATSKASGLSVRCLKD